MENELEKKENIEGYGNTLGELGSYYNLRKCVDCGVKYYGGTNSKRCKDCGIKNNERRIMSRKYYKKIEYLKKLPDNCIFCGSKKSLEIHHIDANPKNNDIKNLLRICCKCHRVLHSKIYNKIFSPEIRKAIKLWQKEPKQKKREIKI